LIGRILYHAAGLAFLTWVVLVPLKWAFLAGLAIFGLHAWGSRPGGEERARTVEEAQQERPIPREEQVQGEVNRASTVTLRLVGQRWLNGTVQATNPTNSVVELEAVSCAVLFRPDVGPRHEVSNRAPWRIRVEPGASFRGDVSFDSLNLSGSPTALAEYRCKLGVRVVPAPTAPTGAPSNPIRMTPTGYRMGAVR
jgi:hypothetical protein